MKNVSLVFYVYWLELLSVVFREFYSHYCHVTWWSVDSVFEHFLILLRKFINACSKWLGINPKRWSHKSKSIRSTSINFIIFGLKCVNIKLKLLNFLHIDQMEMNRMSIRCKVNKIEIINFPCFVCTIFTIHTSHHRDSINKHSNWITIRILHLH